MPRVVPLSCPRVDVSDSAMLEDVFGFPKGQGTPNPRKTVFCYLEKCQVKFYHFVPENQNLLLVPATVTPSLYLRNCVQSWTNVPGSAGKMVTKKADS